MRYVVLVLLLSISIFRSNAQKYLSDSSYVHFFSSAPMEDIEAVNVEGKGAVNLSTAEFAFKIPIKGFEFDKSLMQEHFNENYLESDKYPNAIFKGKIADWTGMKGKQKVTATGTMEIHGVERDVSIKSEIHYTDDFLKIRSNFPVTLEDYKIKIPKAVFYNIAEVVDVTVYFNCVPYEE